ncbi:MAG: PIN domain-containing protein [Alphaproteobacteria bacterium]
MTKNILLDTNIIIRYFLKDHEEFSALACITFNKIKQGIVKAYITNYIFAEIVFVLQNVYNIPKNEISEALNDLLLIKGIIMDNKALISEALNIYSTKNLSIIDSMLVVEGKYLKYDIETFDKALAKVAKNNLL